MIDKEKKRKAYNNGVAFTLDEVGKLNELQGFARTQGVKVADSKALRILAIHAVADPELAQAVREIRMNAGTVWTSISWTEAGLNAVQDLAKELQRIDKRLGRVWVAEVARALVIRMHTSMTFAVGILRTYLDDAQEAGRKARDGKQ